jgi:hypothetical protein
VARVTAPLHVGRYTSWPALITAYAYHQALCGGCVLGVLQVCGACVVGVWRVCDLGTAMMTG